MMILIENKRIINMTEQYLTIRQVMAWLHLGRSSIYRRIEDGTLPKPIKIGHLSRFKESEIKVALEAIDTQRHS
jgi:excisionase family DNA binding protein